MNNYDFKYRFRNKFSKLTKHGNEFFMNSKYLNPINKKEHINKYITYKNKSIKKSENQLKSEIYKLNFKENILKFKLSFFIREIKIITRY